MHHATPRGREMRGSENRLHNARRACTCCSESGDSCAPVCIAASRVAPTVNRWPSRQRVGRPCTCMPHQGVEKCEGPRTGSTTHAALAHAVSSRETAVRLFASPHLALPLPRPCAHLRHATPRGREMRGPENRLHNARRACTCCSDDSCAQSHHRFSMVENRPRRPPAPTCVQAS